MKFFGSYVMGYLRSANLLDPFLERTSHEIKPMMLRFTVEGKKSTRAELAHHYSQRGSSLEICWFPETHSVTWNEVWNESSLEQSEVRFTDWKL